MVVVRGVNVYPTAIENLVRAFPQIDEFQVTVKKVNEMTELGIEVEVVEGDAEGIARELRDTIQTKLSLRPEVELAPRGSLLAILLFPGSL